MNIIKLSFKAVEELLAYKTQHSIDLEYEPKI